MILLAFYLPLLDGTDCSQAVGTPLKQRGRFGSLVALHSLRNLEVIDQPGLLEVRLY